MEIYKKDVKHRIVLASAMFWQIKQDVEDEQRIRNRNKTVGRRPVYREFVTPALTYGSECWCLRKEDERRIRVVEMRQDWQ